MELENEVVVTRLPTAIGWIATLARVMEDDERKIDDIIAEFQDISHFKNGSRVCHGWAIFFTFQRNRIHVTSTTAYSHIL